MFKLNYFFTVGSFFNVEGYAHESIDYVARMLEKEGADAYFTFKVDAFARHRRASRSEVGSIRLSFQRRIAVNVIMYTMRTSFSSKEWMWCSIRVQVEDQ